MKRGSSRCAFTWVSIFSPFKPRPNTIELYGWPVTNGQDETGIQRDTETRFKKKQFKKTIPIQAENLLLDSDMNIKIADFGFSNHFAIGELGVGYGSID